MKFDKLKRVLEDNKTRKNITLALDIMIALGKKGKECIEDYNSKRPSRKILK